MNAFSPVLYAECDRNRTTRGFIKPNGEAISINQILEAFDQLEARRFWIEVIDETNAGLRAPQPSSIEAVGRVWIEGKNNSRPYTPEQVIEKLENFQAEQNHIDETIFKSLFEATPDVKAIASPEIKNKPEANSQAKEILQILAGAVPGAGSGQLPVDFFDTVRKSEAVTIQEQSYDDTLVRMALGLAKIQPVNPVHEQVKKLATSFTHHARRESSSTLSFLLNNASQVATRLTVATQDILKDPKKGKLATETFNLIVCLGITAASIATQPELPLPEVTQTSDANANAEKIQCEYPALPDRLETRIDLWKQHPFYQSMMKGSAKDKARVAWVEPAAQAIQDLWTAKPEFFKEAGFEGPDHMFMIAMRFATIESIFNKKPTNAKNPQVLGMYHINASTFNSLIEKRDWLKDLPGFNGQKPSLDKRKDGYIATAVAITLIADDFIVTKHKLGENPDEFAQELFSYYGTHVDGAGVFTALTKAAVNEETKTVKGRKVRKTAVDVAGRGVAHDNPSLFYKVVEVQAGKKTKHVVVELLPEEHLQKIRDRLGKDNNIYDYMTTGTAVNAHYTNLRKTPEFAPQCKAA